MGMLTTRKPQFKVSKKLDKSLHAELVREGARWLRKTVGSSLVIEEMACYNGTGEIPDIIGWKSGYSVLIECKTSRSDFLADKKKLFRRYPDMGMGVYRLFLCPDGIILSEDLPENWGLLYYDPFRTHKIKRIECFKGNIVTNEGQLKAQPVNYKAENALLISYARRREEGK